MSESKVYQADGGDPNMLQAYENARATFRYLWREVAWDRQRIIPALDMACVKAPFSDGTKSRPKKGVPDVEHMWIADIDFDGQFIHGVLQNSPNWVKSVKQGDEVKILPNEISDWMYAISDVAYGAYTVNLLRSRMGSAERKEHDKLWGLDFGDPEKIRTVSEAEHLKLSEEAAKSLKEALDKNPELVSSTGHRGWTLLHQKASQGSVAGVKVLLEAGADPKAKTDEGFTPLQLAQSLGWESVVTLLARK